MNNQDNLNFNISLNNSPRNPNITQAQPQAQPQFQPQTHSNTNANPEHNNQDEVTMTNFIQKSSNPIICLFTVLFKLINIISFILLDLFTNNESLVILIVILLGAIDFWFTKNISGRKLVGLRWWNQVQPNGKETWQFESKGEGSHQSKADVSTFWTSLYVNTIFWLVMFIWELIRFKFIWSTVSLILTILAGTNTYGYFKCSKSHQENMMALGTKFALGVGKTALNNAAS